MAWHRRDRQQTDNATYGARAVLVPLEARNTLGNESNLSADSRATTQLTLVVAEVGEDGVTGGTAQQVIAQVPSWLRIVFHYAGSNDGPSAQLPAEVELAVHVDPATGKIVAVDVPRAETELAAYRATATRWWKETEAPLADVRGLVSFPREALRGVRGIAGAWRDAAAQLRADRGPGDGPASPAHGEAEREQLRRTANVVSHRVAADPKVLGRVRASALEAGPMMVANVRSGSMAMADLESWLQYQAGSGAITESEAAAWRAEASNA